MTAVSLRLFSLPPANPSPSVLKDVNNVRTSVLELWLNFCLHFGHRSGHRHAFRERLPLSQNDVPGRHL